MATLVNEVKQPGRYEVVWDAGGLPGGVYFYKMTARSAGPPGTYTSVKKLLFVK